MQHGREGSFVEPEGESERAAFTAVCVSGRLDPVRGWM